MTAVHCPHCLELRRATGGIGEGGIRPVGSSLRDMLQRLAVGQDSKPIRAILKIRCIMC